MDLHNIMDWLAAVFIVVVIVIIFGAYISAKTQNFKEKRKRKKAGEA